MDYNKLFPIEKIFFSNDHILDYIMTIAEAHENKWIKHLQTLTPNNFNIKLYHPQNTTLK